MLTLDSFSKWNIQFYQQTTGLQASDKKKNPNKQKISKKKKKAFFFFFLYGSTANAGEPGTPKNFHLFAHAVV